MGGREEEEEEKAAYPISHMLQQGCLEIKSLNVK